MRNKKTIMAFAGLQILIFHLWINLTTGNNIEMFLKATAYVGVDIFFFVSAYSLSKTLKPDINKEEYGKFLLSRFKSVYLKFILFAVLAFFVSNWKINKLLLTIFSIDLFIKGGGSFLWFLPAIMIFYIVVPLIYAFDFTKKYNLSSKAGSCIKVSVILVLWFVLGLLITYFTGYKALFIFINRIPVIVLGFILSKSEAFEKICRSKKNSVIWGLVLVSLGTYILYVFGYREKLQVPLRDFFYIMAIPAVVGLILLLSNIPSFKIIKKIGSSTLEMYAIQMVFGYKIANLLHKNTNSAIITNILTIFIVVFISVIVSDLYNKVIIKNNK